MQLKEEEDFVQLIEEALESHNLENVVIHSYVDNFEAHQVFHIQKVLNGTKYGAEITISHMECSQSENMKDLFKRKADKQARALREYEFDELGKQMQVDGRDITILTDDACITARCEQCKYTCRIGLDTRGTLTELYQQTLQLYAAGEINSTCPCSVYRNRKF